MNSLSPARHTTETFPNYQARRKLVNKRVAQVLAGKLFPKAVEIFHLPAIGKDNKVDALVSRNEIIIVDTIVQKNGDILRIGKSKGVTYRRKEAKPKRIGFLRRQARKTA